MPETKENTPIGENTPSVESYISAVCALLNTAPNQEASQSMLYKALYSLIKNDNIPTLRALLTAAPDELIQAVFAERRSSLWGVAGISQDNLTAIKILHETMVRFFAIDDFASLITNTLRGASMNGRTEVVRYLLEVLENEENIDTQATLIATQEGFTSAADKGKQDKQRYFNTVKAWLNLASDATKRIILRQEFIFPSPEMLRLLLNACPDDATRQAMLIKQSERNLGCYVPDNKIEIVKILFDAATRETLLILLHSLLKDEYSTRGDTQKAMNTHPEIALELLFQTQHVLQNEPLYQGFLNLMDEANQTNLSTRVKEKLGLMLQLYTTLEDKICPEAALHILGQFSLRPSESPVLMRMLHTLKPQEAADSPQASSDTSSSHSLGFFSLPPAPENATHASKEESDEGLEEGEPWGLECKIEQ